MKSSRRVNVLSGCLTLLVLAVSGCVYDPYPGPPPPPHPHYYPYYYDYYYYPSVSVYFHFTTGYYYYYYDNRWVRARALPAYIHLNPKERIQIRTDNDKPYLKNKDYQAKYANKPGFKPDVRLDREERESNRRVYEVYKAKKYPEKTPDRKGAR